MKMQIICACTAYRSLSTVSFMVYVLFFATALGAIEIQGKQDYSEKSTPEEDNEYPAAQTKGKQVMQLAYRGIRLSIVKEI